MSSKKDFRESAQHAFATPAGQAPALAPEIPHNRYSVPQLRAARLIPLGLIDPDPENPRSGMDARRLRELADSIKEHGVLQPISVRWIEETARYTILSGHRRYQAATLAQVKEIPALVVDADDRTNRRILQLVENTQREDLSPIDEAETYAAIMEASGYTQVQLAKALAKSKAEVSEVLKLRELPEAIKAEVRTSELSKKSLFLEANREADPAARDGLFHAILSGEFRTVRQLREHKRQAKKAPSRRPKHKAVFKTETGATVTVQLTTSKADAEAVRSALRDAMTQASRGDAE
ncbi:MAG: ParB/RepB/Spo0J family partition protein [Candidatus Methylomirabilis sp.]|nr:ParB/RepB/Spo0J family partition protein [Deltaproteobacteria bacterium]